LLLLSTASCWAQASEAEMRAFPMPPQNGFAGISSWNQPPYYGYFVQPTASRPTPAGGAATDYSYILYDGRGLFGTTAVFWGDWGTTYIPPPDPSGGDACFHAHVSYGVWALVQRRIHFFSLFSDRTFNEFRFMGGGGLSGERRANGQCIHKTNTSLAQIDP